MKPKRGINENITALKTAQALPSEREAHIQCNRRELGNSSEHLENCGVAKGLHPPPSNPNPPNEEIHRHHHSLR